jgi:hypothetical protein
MALKKYVSDKTDWRKMLKGQSEVKDMLQERERLIVEAKTELSEVQAANAEGQIEFLADAQPVEIEYPVLQYPEKVSSLNFDKMPDISGILLGIKGQYLILDTGVLNIRKFTSYNISFDA